MGRKKLIDKIKKYREIKANIVNIDLDLKELDNEMLGCSSIELSEKTGKTYKITSTTENQAMRLIERKKELNTEKEKLKIEVERIDNAMSILDDDEKTLVEMKLINNKKMYLIQDKLRISYSRARQIEMEALMKMEPYLPCSEKL